MKILFKKDQMKAENLIFELSNFIPCTHKNNKDIADLIYLINGDPGLDRYIKYLQCQIEKAKMEENKS